MFMDLAMGAAGIYFGISTCLSVVLKKISIIARENLTSIWLARERDSGVKYNRWMTKQAR
jgi:hypothetical protein